MPSVKLKPFICFWPQFTQHVRLVPRPRMVLEPPPLAAWRLVHWTAWEVLSALLIPPKNQSIFKFP